MQRVPCLWKGVIALLAFSLCSSCAPPSTAPVFTREGKTYGEIKGPFRHRWWHYYERALSYAEGAFYDYAVSDLKEAINQRDGDQRRARTYGMHFIDYFPHRELGVIHYFTGNLEDAERELELSIAQFPTSKARFYLDRVRKSRIQQEAREAMPPSLTLFARTDEFWTRDDPVMISGVAEDDHYVSSVKIQGTPVFLEVSQKRFAFEEGLRLSQGRHLIEVEAISLSGKVSKKYLTIHVDREGPTITLDTLTWESSSDPTVTLSGWVHDEAGVSGFSINGRPVDVKNGVEGFFEGRFVSDRGELEFKATDRLGNRTIARISMAESSNHAYPVRTAFTDSAIQAVRLSVLFGSGDEEPPEIKLRDWSEEQTVYQDRIYLEGEVSDQNKIERLSINEIPILRKKGCRIFFNHLARLQKGKNIIRIQVKDEAGNMATRQITVVRETPAAMRLQERLSLTVAPFSQGESLTETGLAFQENLIHAFVHGDRFRIIERDRLDLILREHKLSRTELIDQSTALKMGRLAAVHTVVTGRIVETRAGVEIVARLIDTETSEVLATEDVYGEMKDPPALKSLAEGMVIKFYRDFPLLDGHVIQKKGNYVLTDLGKEKLRSQRRLIVYREEPVRHPSTGKLLGMDNVILAYVHVTQIMPEMSKAEISKLIGDSVKGLDKVIPR